MLLDRSHFQNLFQRSVHWPANGDWNQTVVSAAECCADHLSEHPKTGQLLLWVPPGKFATDTGGGAPFTMDLPGFHIGLHPVTNQQYAQFVREAKHLAPDNKFWQEAAKAQHPVTDVSWDDATAYCQWAGLRLPGELEWEKAVRWLDGRAFPWGKDWDQSRCRNGKNKGRETTADVWRYGNGCCLVGGYQMSGNVWEWCADWYDDKAYIRYREGNLTPAACGSSRVLRGGSWGYVGPGYFSASCRGGVAPVSHDDLHGFRCVLGSDASPS